MGIRVLRHHHQQTLVRPMVQFVLKAQPQMLTAQVALKMSGLKSVEMDKSVAAQKVLPKQVVRPLVKSLFPTYRTRVALKS